MRCLYHVFSWLTQCNQTFPLADCSEENPVPYRAGNRDHRVTDGTQNCACNRGNTDALHRVKYPVHRTGKLFTGLPGQIPCTARPAGGSSGDWRHGREALS